MYALENKVAYQFPNPSGDGIYVLDVQRLRNWVVSITSDQRLSVFDAERIDAGPIFSTPVSHGNLTHMGIYSPAGFAVTTAGQDGTVALWDLREQGKSAQKHHFKAADAAITALACDSRTSSVAVGTEFQDKTHCASIFVWDVRSTPTQFRAYTDFHSDDITDLRWNPTDSGLLLSGSTDGLVNVGDIRVTDEDEVILQTFNHDAPIHHADFLSSTEVFAISQDERFALYDMADEVEKGSALLNVGDLREAIGCQYVANVKSKTDGSGAIIGAGAQDKQAFTLLHMAKTENSWHLAVDSAVTLPGAHGDELVREFCFFDESNAIFTGGEDGSIKGWVPPS